MPQQMRLRILLPYRVFAEVTEVARVVVQTTAGALGLLPRRLDCAAVLTPGILTYQCTGAQEQFIAVAGGILVKTGGDVWISVREAIGGADLGGLREAIRRQYVHLGTAEQSARTIIAKLESDFVRRFIELKHER
jgi:F-type H+-transporting ATPase subunit epsilon